MTSLYIHVPFCARKCFYCDFASYPHREDMWQAYFDALSDELRIWIAETGRKFDTAFIGGGTPSLVDAKYIAKIARMIDADEFTIEANPCTVTHEKLDVYLDCGINRLSMGVQSFDDNLLKSIGRLHDSATAIKAFETARAAGFENINIDLMYALPNQSIEAWRNTLDTAIKLNPEHISAYSLIIEEGTPIAKTAVPIEDDTVNAMQRLCTKTLAEAGYLRYEISNYAKIGRECRHNLVYWNRGDYIGVGCAAHSMYKNARFSNHVSLDEYMRGARKLDYTVLTQNDIIEETVMLGLRTARGIKLSDIPDRRAADRLINGKLAETDGEYFRLTEKGMELQNACVLELLGDL